MDTPIEQLIKNMEELSSMFNSRMGEFEKTLSQPGTAAVPNPTIKTLASEFYTFKTFAWKSLGLLKSQVELVTLGMDRLETQFRRKILLFHGVKEDKDENVYNKTVKILINQMNLSDAKSEMIETCHRLGTKKDTTRPILVRFNNVQFRSRVWKAKTTLKSSKITVTEFLTKCRQETFKAARNHFGIKKCWSTDGVIIVILPDETRVKVTSASELKLLVAKYPNNGKEKPNKNK